MSDEPYRTEVGKRASVEACEMSVRAAISRQKRARPIRQNNILELSARGIRGASGIPTASFGLRLETTA